MENALVIGSSGTIGSALTERLRQNYVVSTVSRQNTDYTQESLVLHRDKLAEKGPFEIIVCCIGVLHNQKLAPEKSLAKLDEKNLLEYFRINTVIPSLCLKVFLPLLRKREQSAVSKFAVLSAMVGSIQDNRLGGWYGYRSSKAALNMMVKTASIEAGRLNKNIAIVAIHPGTTRGPLSIPFSNGINKDKYYTPGQSADRIIGVIESLEPKQNGQFLNWDGQPIPW